MNVLDALRQVTTSIKSWVDDNKVQKISGKGLSTNDYTNEDKNKVNQIDNMPNDLVVLDGKLYLAQDGVIMDDSAVTLPSGGGGASSGSVTLTNNLSSTDITAVVDGDVLLQFNYMSSEDETGNGTAYIYVGDVLKMTKKIFPGDNTINIGACVSEGTNIVKLTCMDQYSNYRNLSYTVEVVSLRLSSTFDDTVPYNSDISYTYTPVINATKTVHFILDGSEIGTQEVTTSGRQETYIIPQQPHGSHTLEVYFTVDINDKPVPSNHLYYDLICITDGGTTPIISCSYNNYNITQFETIVIPYVIYFPTSLTSNVTLSANGSVVNQLTVDRTKQSWSFRADEYGELVLTITCGSVVKTLRFNVEQSEIDVTATNSDLELHLSSYGRNNNEENPAIWSYGDMAASFSNFNFSSDGWQLDDDGVTVLRISGDARLEIPAQIFANDFRSTGKTIEVEFTAKEVLDYEAVIMSCMSGDRGIQITAQRADLFSEQSTIGTQYKENEHLRISFVIEKKSENRFLLVYINGILSGAEVYPADDDFTQVTPVGITIGSNYCTTDVYCIRVYNNSLTRHQILDNWIADTQNGSLMLDRYSRNQIYNVYGDVTIDKLPADLPYLIIESSVLPQYKGDKKTCSGRYVDFMDSSKSFTFSNAQIDVQGTSSQYYYVKNYKIKFKNGFKDDNGVEYENYQLNSNAVPTNVFTFKADVASSEGANNVVLAQIYNDLCPVLTPPQKEDSRVRQTIDGHPIVVFWDDGTNITFLGKYNFNNDKGTSEVFGFSEGDESWEIRQNGTDLVGWKSDDFSGDWSNDFEARYPEDNMDITNLQALSTWLVSTNTEAATNEELPSPITYDDVQYTVDSAEYRLAKFRAELPEHADIDAMIFYYLITEIFLCIDQREKNAFPTLFSDSGRWLILFYDADSSLGIDNKGKLAFDPYLEDIDYTEGGDPVYNGQGSVLFVNLRKAFYQEIMEMYQQLRIDGLISYDIVNGKFEEHQNKWCEAIFNEDMYRKCLTPMIVDKDSQYLPMLLGKKEMQRKWWLYNRFRFLDSKYITGNSMDTRIMIRAKSKANVWLTPYVNMYGHVYYNDEMVEHRMERGKSYEYVWSASGAEDAVIGINDADMLTSLGDLSSLQVETIDISLATHLTSLKIGDAVQDYSNKNLTSVTFGNNILLRSIDLRNCSALNTSIDVSGCTNVEQVYCEGTSITGINLPVGGVLKTLHLPDTITNLTIRNQPSLTDFVLNDSSNLTTLRLENVGSLIDTPSVINNMADGSRIRALDIDWEVNSEADLTTLLNKLIKMRGLDENGNNTDLAVLTGRIRVNEKVSDEIVGTFYEYFNDVVIDDGTQELYILNYKDRDGKILYSVRVAEGANAIDPIVEGYIDMPEPIITETYKYEFANWSDLPTNISKHHIIIAEYSTEFAIKFYNGNELIYQQWSIQGDAAIDPVATGLISTPTKEGTDDIRYIFDGWDNLPTNVQKYTSVYAVFANVYPVRYYATESSTTPHYVQWVKEGENAYDPIEAGECQAPSDIVTPNEKKLVFSKWHPPGNVTNIMGVYAMYDTYWAARFWNDDNLYLLEWVLNGANAIEPKDYFEDYINPTRESTAQYDYSFSSWDGYFEALSEARDYYAVYSNTIRRYNVYFYNDTELLQTVENVQYGANAYYTGSTPVKTGVDNPEEYVFKGWLPAPKSITGETYCYALFKFTGYLFGKLSDGSEYGTVDNPNWDAINPYWRTIQEDVAAYKAGNISENELTTKYPIGGRMIIPVALSDGTVTADVEIIGHNHDNLADDSGKTPLTFFCADLPQILRRMNGDSSNAGGWKASEMREFTNGELFDALPAELQDIIKPVYKVADGGTGNKVLVTTIDKCWLASYDEIGLTNGGNNLSGQGELYSSIFSSDKNSRKKYITDDIVSGGWWLRSSYYSTNSNSMFWRVTNSGGSYSDIAFNSFYVAFGFCI